MKKLYLLLSLFSNLCLFGLANIYPKNKTIWVFGSWFGKRYNDSPKALFEYTKKHRPDIIPVWISRDKSVVNQLRTENCKAHYYCSPIGIYYQLKAGVTFVSTSVHDDLFAPCNSRSTKNVQLWHGIPLKKIMFDAYSEHKEDVNLKGKIHRWLTPYNRHRNDYLISTSELTRQIMGGAFKVDLDKTLITGFPRNDIFLEATQNKVRKQPFQCIYMPTHRGGMGGNFNLFERFGFDVDTIDQVLAKHDIQLTLRLHPFNAPSQELIESISKAKFVKIDTSGDIYDSICSYDCLITDYSSIYFDFLLTDRPIIFSAFDIEEYKQKERELYFEFEDVTLEPNCLDWHEVIERLVDIRVNGIGPVYQSAYKKLKDDFHATDTLGKQSFSKNLLDSLAI